LPARLITAVKITAILFLFVFLCFAAPGRDSAGKQAARKNAGFTATLRDSSKGKDTISRAHVSKRDSGAVARGQVKPAKPVKTAADTGSAKAAPKKADTVLTKITVHPTDTVLSKVAVHTADTVKPAASVKKDTVSGLPAAVRLSMDSSVEIATSAMKASEKKMPEAAALHKKWPPASKRMLFIYILVFLAAAAIITGTVNVVMKQTQQPRFLTTTRLSVMDKEVQKACRYIEKNFANPELSAKSICADLVTGEAFLEALMVRDLGISVGDFITHVRINRARVLLEKDPTLAKETAAQETGFSDAESFGAAFKKITGTPFEDFSRLLREKA
jgi:AraC-like DNA-binding protein